jgi:hypothetical protein
MRVVRPKEGLLNAGDLQVLAANLVQTTTQMEGTAASPSRQIQSKQESSLACHSKQKPK